MNGLANLGIDSIGRDCRWLTGCCVIPAVASWAGRTSMRRVTSPGGPIPGMASRPRIEHWTNAVEQAEHVARTVLAPDARREYAPIEYVWTEQYGCKIQVSGRPGGHPVVVADGGARLGVLYGDDQERLAGAVTADWPRAMLAARSVLAADGRVGAAHDRWLDLAGRP